MAYTYNKKAQILTIVTTVLSTFLLFSSNTADLDWSITELDMSGYRTLFEQYDILHHEDFKMYYIFYSCMYLGQSIGLSYRVWWAIMSILAMSVIVIACKVHKYNLNLFLATFMAYYEMVFYSGFKFFYGFCFLLLAYGFLFTKTRKRQLLFVLFTCIAGGFHMMYYFFLVLLIKPIKNPQYMVRCVVIISVITTIFMRLSGSAISFMMPFFNMFENDHINRYTVSTVNAGFYLVIFIHTVLIYIVYKFRIYEEARIRRVLGVQNENQSSQRNLILRKKSGFSGFIQNSLSLKNKPSLRRSNILNMIWNYKINKYGVRYANIETLYYSVLLSLLFCPFYAVSLAFMRLITAFSLVVITASSSILNTSYESRVLCTKMSLLMVVSFYLIRIFSIGFIEKSVIPYFDVF